MSASPDTTVAIIGMACHFPGARNVEEFRVNLRGGKESITHFTDEELSAAGVDPALLANPNYVKASGVLDRMEWFDAGFFGLSPRDAAVMDPQTRHFLECCWHALEHGGHVPGRFEGTIGVFAGAGAGRYFWQNVVRDQALLDEVGYFLLRHTGNDKDFLASRASYDFDLRGPSVSIQTACSTSLVAVHYACQSLLGWECDMALAGGVTIEQPHIEGYLYEEGEILSPDGHCRSFDHRAGGTVFGSGAGVVLLRRLADAIEDGDPIHAVIRGSAVNNDGAGKVSYLAPSVDGQIKVVAEALEVADVEPGSIGLVEGHGTATPVGDPIEVTALSRAFRTRTTKSAFCALGSVKSNIGHLDTAAGVASLIKAVLAVEDGDIPPTVHFERPNPMMELEGSPFYVNADLRPWPRELAPRRAGVTSLGVGGTNAHVVIEQAPLARPTTPSRSYQLVTLSARSGPALEDASRTLIDHLEAHPDASLADVAHTLHVGRKRFSHRRSLVCRSASEAIEVLAAASGASVTARSEAEAREVAFLFAGGGAQYPNMGRELYEAEAVFREVVDRCLHHLRRSEGQDLTSLLFCRREEEEKAARALQRPSAALPALFAIQLAQARLWMSWGVTPSAMIGHSMGEYTAACLAGVFTPEEGMSLVALRGRLFETVDEGGMLSVSLGERALRRHLDADVSIAAVNAPEVSVAAGPVDAIDALERKLREEGVECRRVRIDVAAHSSMLEPILSPFGEHVRTVELRPPTLPVISNLTGEVAGEEMTEPEYWVRHLRETVRFSEGIGRLMGPDGPILLEVGPGRTLATVARMHPERTPEQPALHSLPHVTEPEDALAFQMRTLGALWVHGVDVDWDAYTQAEVRSKVALPGYPFERAPYFVSPPAAASSDGPEPLRTTAGRADLEAWFYKSAWEPTLLDERSTDGSDLEQVVVLADPASTADRLADRLATRGCQVTRIRRGERFEAAGADSYTVRPRCKEDWTALVRALHADGRAPAVILHGWCLGHPTSAAEPEATSFFGTLHLFQALEDELPGSAVRFVALTSRAVAVSGEDPLDASRALLLGPVRVAPKEIPNLSARLVDVGSVPSDRAREEPVLDRLEREVRCEVADTVVAYRGGDRLTERFAGVRLAAGGAGDGIRDGGTYLITGGLGGIGLVIARELAEAKHVSLALLARTPLPSPERRAEWLKEHPADDKTSRAIREVESLERLGAEVLVLGGDVADESRMREVIGTVTEHFGGLHGVFHTAGILDDGPLLARSPEQAEAVLRPKVAGTLALDAALEGVDLDFLLLFSSVSAVIGAPGQVDYAAANSFLDAFARSRAQRTVQRTVSVAWGAWRDVGMAAELAGEARYESTSDDDATEVEHTYFDTVAERPSGERAFRTRFEQGRHWMLDEHRLRGGPWVLPGSGYVELIRAATREVSAGDGFEMRDLVFLRPFRVRNGESKELEVGLTPTGKGWAVTVRGRATGGEAGWVDHAMAVVAADPADPQVPEGLPELEKRLGMPERAARAPHPVMDFGPRWDNITAESTNGREALLQQVLPATFAADPEREGLHPALLDMATAGAQHLVPGVDVAKDLLVPAGYGKLRMTAPLGTSVTSHVTLRSAEEDGALASFDVTIYDQAGSPVVTVEDFSMIRVEGDIIADAEEAETPRWLQDAISPAEGRAALRRILSQDTGAHLFVATRPLDALITEAAQSPVRATRRAETSVPGPLRELLPSVTEALEAHEAVAEAAALGSPESDPVRVVAFVVYEPGAQATVSELRRFVRGRLEKRLIPQNFVEMVSLPRSEDGSVTVAELRDPFAAVDDYVAPRTGTQEVIARIWSELLALDRVGIHDNFLDVGGHSLVGIRALRRIQQETGVRLEANALTMQTLEQLAAEVDRESAA